jgi:hypothetical protein
MAPFLFHDCLVSGTKIRHDSNTSSCSEGIVNDKLGSGRNMASTLPLHVELGSLLQIHFDFCEKDLVMGEES